MTLSPHYLLGLLRGILREIGHLQFGPELATILPIELARPQTLAGISLTR